MTGVEGSQKGRQFLNSQGQSGLQSALGRSLRSKELLISMDCEKSPVPVHTLLDATDTPSLGHLIRSHQCHKCADTSQMYISRLNLSSDLHTHLSKGLLDIATPVSKKHLKLYMSKIKLRIFTPHLNTNFLFPQSCTFQ